MPPLTAVLISQAFQFSHSLQRALYTNSFAFVTVFPSCLPLPLSFLSLFRTRTATIELVFHFFSSLQIVLVISLQTNTVAPHAYAPLPFYFPFQILFGLPNRFPKSPLILNIPTFHYSPLHGSANYKLRGHPLA